MFVFRIHHRSEIIDFLDKYLRSLWWGGLCAGNKRFFFCCFLSCAFMKDQSWSLDWVNNAERQQGFCSILCEVPLTRFFLFFSNAWSSSRWPQYHQIINQHTCRATLLSFRAKKTENKLSYWVKVTTGDICYVLNDCFLMKFILTKFWRWFFFQYTKYFVDFN